MQYPQLKDFPMQNQGLRKSKPSLLVVWFFSPVCDINSDNPSNQNRSWMWNFDLSMHLDSSHANRSHYLVGYADRRDSTPA